MSVKHKARLCNSLLGEKGDLLLVNVEKSRQTHKPGRDIPNTKTWFMLGPIDGSTLDCVCEGLEDYYQHNDETNAHTTTVVNPYQRCEYSDLPCASKDTFLYCSVQEWVGGGDNWAPTRKKVDPKKNTCFL